MTYFPIYLLFSLSAGSLLKLLPILLPQRAGHILTVLLSFLLTLLFAAELIPSILSRPTTPSAL